MVDRFSTRLALLLFAAFLLVGLLVASGLAEGFDKAAMAAVGAARAGRGAHLAVLVSDAGSFWGRGALALAGAGLLYWQGRRRPAGLMLLIAVSGAVLVALIKAAVGRARPEESLRLAHVGDASFPSAHAGNAMVVALALALLLAPPRWRAAAVAAALVAAGLVGLSRVMLWVHWPSDVIAGWLFGAALVLGWVAWAKGRRWL